MWQQQQCDACDRTTLCLISGHMCLVNLRKPSPLPNASPNQDSVATVLRTINDIVASCSFLLFLQKALRSALLKCYVVNEGNSVGMSEPPEPEWKLTFSLQAATLVSIRKLGF